MKKTIITLNLDDIFTFANQSSNRLFSSASVSVSRNTPDSVEQLCSELGQNLSKSRASGNIVARIITPIEKEITMEESMRILDKMQKFSTQGCMFGVESDDSTDRLTVDLMFEIAPGI